MEKVYDKCCGIDVHKKLIVACLRKGNKQEIRDFGATTRELLELADWLKEGGTEGGHRPPGGGEECTHELYPLKKPLAYSIDLW